MYTLRYFKKAKQYTVRSNDFKRPESTALINLARISSISELTSVIPFFASRPVGSYAVLTMSNGDCYYLNKDAYKELINMLFGRQPKNSELNNSEIGSYHWYVSLVSFQKRVGEYIEKRSFEEVVLNNWAERLKETADELIRGYDYINK